MKARSELVEEIVEDITSQIDLDRAVRDAVWSSVDGRFAALQEERHDVIALAQKIAREHRCRVVGCRCGEEIAMDLEAERLR